MNIDMILARNINEKLYNKISLFIKLLEDNGECTKLYFFDYNDKGEYLNVFPHSIPMFSVAIDENSSFNDIVHMAKLTLTKIRKCRTDMENRK